MLNLTDKEIITMKKKNLNKIVVDLDSEVINLNQTIYDQDKIIRKLRKKVKKRDREIYDLNARLEFFTSNDNDDIVINSKTHDMSGKESDNTSEPNDNTTLTIYSLNAGKDGGTLRFNQVSHWNLHTAGNREKNCFIEKDYMTFHYVSASTGNQCSGFFLLDQISGWSWQ